MRNIYNLRQKPMNYYNKILNLYKNWSHKLYVYFYYFNYRLLLNLVLFNQCLYIFIYIYIYIYIYEDNRVETP